MGLGYINLTILPQETIKYYYFSVSFIASSRHYEYLNNYNPRYISSSGLKMHYKGSNIYFYPAINIQYYSINFVYI